MQTLFSLTSDFVICPRPSPFYREDIFLSPGDASRLGLSKTEQFVLLNVEPEFPGPPMNEYAVCLHVNPEIPSGTVSINQLFFESLGLLSSTPDISCQTLEKYAFLQEMVIESSVEVLEAKKMISALKEDYTDIFTNRCLLYTVTNQENELKLPVDGYASFYLRPLNPTLNTLEPGTAVIITKDTFIKLFVSHRKNGVDTVIIIDGSGSMTQYEDYINHRGERDTRLAGVRHALDKLLLQRILSGSRLSRIAIIAFAQYPRMYYPEDEAVMAELHSGQHSDLLHQAIHNLTPEHLEHLQVDGLRTDISAALQYAAKLLYMYSQDTNEKLLILLSDGADWKEDSEEENEGEIDNASKNPVVLAENLYLTDQIHIHTIAISDKATLERFYPDPEDRPRFAIPNTQLLQKIAEVSHGLYSASPDANVLTNLFEDIGQGTTYPL